MKNNESKREHAIKSVKFYEAIDNLIDMIQHDIQWMGDTEITNETTPFSFEYNRHLEKQALNDLVRTLKEIDY